MFAQMHRPGEAMQTDFTWATELGITIGGEPFPHMLCHPVLPYSNWEWASICRSESLPALRTGVQAAVFRLGKVPEWHQTDNSSAATHRPDIGDRKFNEDYAGLMRHLGMKPRTIEVGAKNQNGDVEALNGALKKKIEATSGDAREQGLRQHQGIRGLARGHSGEGNALRDTKLQEELAAMNVLRVSRLPEYKEITVPVTRGVRSGS